MDLINVLFRLGDTAVEDKFDTIFFNSVEYSAGVRSAGSQWVFDYSGTYLGLTVNPAAYGTYPQFSHIAIFVNDELFQVETFSDTSLHEITLPVGFKTVKLVEGIISKPSSIIGTWLTSVLVDSSKFTKHSITNVSEKIVFLGDSITVGANALYPSVNGFPYLFRSLDSKEVAVLGYGYGKVYDFGETAPKIAAVNEHLAQLYSNVTATKKLCIALGTNDFALDSTPVATFEGWYEDLLDGIIAYDNNIDIYCLSPIIRTSDGALLDDYRTTIASLCTAKSLTHITGKTILTTGDLDDGVHPTTDGHLILHDALDDYLI